jgi:hypothetical protein
MRYLGLIIFDPKKDDFLAQIEEKKGATKRSWSQNPKDAKQFKRKQLAINVIRKTIKDTDRILVIAELHDTKEKYEVSFLSQFYFKEGKFIESDYVDRALAETM